MCSERAEGVEICEARHMESNGYRKSNKRNLVTIQNGNHSPLNIDEELDPWTAWAYKPRTITLLLIGACFLM